MIVIFYGILLAHINAYKRQYANIGITFATTYIIKRIVKTSGNKDYGDLVGLGGYTLTFGEFIKLINDMKNAGIQGADSEEANKIIGGLLGKGVDWIKDMIINNK